MNALIATAMFVILQTATPGTTSPQHEHSAMAHPPAAAADSIATPVQQNLSFIAKEFTSVADAMPEEKLSFVPTTGEFTGVRSFGQQVTHVADANLAFAYSIIHNQRAPKDLFKKPASKAEIMAYLKESFDALDRATATLTTQNANEKIANAFGGDNAPYGAPPTRLGVLVLAASHVRDHYGQMVEYLRMNGIVPPPSRK
jgi:uncharacterized damage-inducible protein DinB